MSRGLVWTPEQLAARGWRKLDATPAPRRAGKQLPDNAIPYERDVLRAVLKALELHPRVAWAHRLNTGMCMLPGRGGKLQPVRFGFEGAPDIIGQMGEDSALYSSSPRLEWRKGAFLAVECKRPGKEPTMGQAAFLLTVREAGGVAFCATSVDDVYARLGRL